MPNVTVLGAGPGALTTAALMAEAGNPVTLWNRTPERLRDVVDDSVELIDHLAVGPVAVAVSDDLAQAVAGADCIIAVVPASAHRTIARALRPVIPAGVPVVLMPGRTAGALEVHTEINSVDRTEQNPVFEAQTLPFGCRIAAKGQVRLFATKIRVPLAGIGGEHLQEEIQHLFSALPGDFPFVASTLETGLDNMGAIIHPAFMLSDGLDSFSELAQALDAERVQLGRALGVEVLPLLDWIAQMYDAPRTNLIEALPYHPIWGRFPRPDSIDHRYLTEDLPTGLVPMVALGEAVGCDLPVARETVVKGGDLLGRDFFAEGRTLEHLGLLGATRDGIVEAFAVGRRTRQHI